MQSVLDLVEDRGCRVEPGGGQQGDPDRPLVESGSGGAGNRESSPNRSEARGLSVETDHQELYLESHDVAPLE